MPGSNTEHIQCEETQTVKGKQRNKYLAGKVGQKASKPKELGKYRLFLMSSNKN